MAELEKLQRKEYAQIAKELGYPKEIVRRIKEEAKTEREAERILTNARKEFL